MYTLINRIGLKSLVVLEGPSLLVACLLAEAFYKFGSFTLEALSFFWTWYLLGLFMHRITVWFRRNG